ncbi:MAG: CBS domain-containing protein [Planctomycetia bacterium]|nr:CBS domain-containing protein [Planctomycetia bacterium]
METIFDLLHSQPHHDEPGRASGLGRPLVTTLPTATVREATILMNQHSIGSLLVMQGRRLVGIFTERDVLRRVVAESLSPDTTFVREVMTVDVCCCTTETSIDDVSDLMRDHRVRHVPVLDAHEEVVGLVSIGDVNAHRAVNCAVELNQMHDYLFRRA